jgi:hypothetical protein
MRALAAASAQRGSRSPHEYVINETRLLCWDLSLWAGHSSMALRLRCGLRLLAGRNSGHPPLRLTSQASPGRPVSSLRTRKPSSAHRSRRRRDCRCHQPGRRRRLPPCWRSLHRFDRQGRLSTRLLLRARQHLHVRAAGDHVRRRPAAAGDAARVDRRCSGTHTPGLARVF